MLKSRFVKYFIIIATAVFLLVVVTLKWIWPKMVSILTGFGFN